MKADWWVKLFMDWVILPFLIAFPVMLFWNAGVKPAFNLPEIGGREAHALTYMVVLLSRTCSYFALRGWKLTVKGSR